MRIFVQEQHVISENEIKGFIDHKKRNGFTVKEISPFPVAGSKQNLIIVEKWNIGNTEIERA